MLLHFGLALLTEDGGTEIRAMIWDPDLALWVQIPAL